MLRTVVRRALITLAALVVALPVVFFVGARAGWIGPPAVPAEVVDRSVSRDGAVLRAALALPTAKTYGALQYQSNGSTCGPASLVNVERSLGHTLPDEYALLDGSGMCPFGVCVPGVTLDELAQLARSQTERQVTVLRDLALAEFRAHMQASNDPSRRYVVNFRRKEIFGQGGGHHSPVGGYVADRDEVLVLDVNGHYGPWLVPTEKLFAAMDTLDGEHKRGMLLLQ